MKRTILFAVFIALLAVASFAQTPAPTPAPPPSTDAPNFQMNVKLMSLPNSVSSTAATDIGATFKVTDNFLLRSDNILAPTVNLNSYFGGGQYALPTCGILTKTTLDCSHFEIYVTGSVGISRITVGSNPTAQHIGGLGGFGVNYDPSGGKHYTWNVAEVRYAVLPGINGPTGSNHTWVVSTGLNFPF